MVWKGPIPISTKATGGYSGPPGMDGDSAGEDANIHAVPSALLSRPPFFDAGVQLADQAAPALPPSGRAILYSFNQQGFSVVHVCDPVDSSIEVTRDNITVCRNVTGSTINKGQVVYVSGSTGAVPQVSLAQANSPSTMPALGVMYDTTATNNYGRVMLFGNLENFNLSAFSTGDKLYVSATTAGGLTNVPPALSQFIGTVINNGAGNGILQVHTQNQAAPAPTGPSLLIFEGEGGGGGGDDLFFAVPGATGAGTVASVSDSGAGTTTISPTTGNVLVTVNLAHAFAWTAAHTWNLGSITGATAGIHLDQTIASTAIATIQCSPALQLTAHAWDTGTVADKTFDWAIQAVGISGNPADGHLTFFLSTNGGASWTAYVQFDSTGSNGLTLGSNISLSGLAGSGGLAFGSMTGATVMPSGNWSWTGTPAGGKTFSLVGDLGGADALNATATNIWGATSGQQSINVAGVATGVPAGDVIQVVNNSGSTATANDVGYIGTDRKYTTTTTQGADVSWCVVVVGGAAGATIYVQRSGVATIKCDASNSAGDWLTTSSTAKQAHSNGANFTYSAFAKVITANSGGAGGTCTALLYCNTRFVPYTSSTDLINNQAASASSFTAQINGAPSTTSVAYNNVTAGNGNVLNVFSTTLLSKMILWNTTRGTGRFVTACTGGATGTITTVASTDTWATTDAITITSQTATGGSPNLIDLDLSQQTEIPTTARAVALRLLISDTGAAGQRAGVHPYESFATAKLLPVRTQVSSIFNDAYVIVKLISNRFCWGFDASGTGTATPIARVYGYLEAVP